MVGILGPVGFVFNGGGFEWQPSPMQVFFWPCDDVCVARLRHPQRPSPTLAHHALRLAHIVTAVAARASLAAVPSLCAC
jgi:hypothetical protein